MRGLVFINYSNGVHQNDLEQQRRILSHASRQKRSHKSTALLKNDNKPPRIVAARRSKHRRADNDDHDQPHDGDSREDVITFRRQTKLNPTCDSPLSGLDPFGALPLPMQMTGMDAILQFGTSIRRASL